MNTEVVTPSRFDHATRERLRQRLLHRGATLASLLADILSGRDRSLALASIGLLRPGIRPEEALRNALDKLERRRRLLVADDERYGCCDVCGAQLGIDALEEVPWADRCQAHSSS